jgi:hypothetical protein
VVEDGFALAQRVPQRRPGLLGGALHPASQAADLSLIGAAGVEERQGEGGDHDHEQHAAEHVLLEGGRQDGIVRGDAPGDRGHPHQPFREQRAQEAVEDLLDE